MISVVILSLALRQPIRVIREICVLLLRPRQPIRVIREIRVLLLKIFRGRQGKDKTDAFTICCKRVGSVIFLFFYATPPLKNKMLTIAEISDTLLLIEWLDYFDS